MILNSSLQTGITVNDNVSHHVFSGTPKVRKLELTVNSNSNAFSQLIAVRAHEGWNETKLINLQIFCTKRPLSYIGVDDLKIELVCLSNSSDGCGSGIALDNSFSIMVG